MIDNNNAKEPIVLKHAVIEGMLTIFRVYDLMNNKHRMIRSFGV